MATPPLVSAAAAPGGRTGAPAAPPSPALPLRSRPRRKARAAPPGPRGRSRGSPGPQAPEAREGRARGGEGHGGRARGRAGEGRGDGGARSAPLPPPPRGLQPSGSEPPPPPPQARTRAGAGGGKDAATQGDAGHLPGDGPATRWRTIKKGKAQVEEEEPTGYIRFEKFLPVMTKVLLEKRYRPIPEDILLRAFEVLDPSKRGFLTKEELIKYMTEEGEPFSQEEMEEMLSAAIDPESNSIRYKDYIAMMVVDDG
uniref:EF-hand calcium binding domain 2 n=1 Tax=Canis lupus familiaris TaxID=9615 RepID=A0A8I3MPS4_CANLF